MNARDVIATACRRNIDADLPWGAVTDDIFAALAAAGFAVVPVEPSGSMIEAGAAQIGLLHPHGEDRWNALVSYRAMIAAAGEAQK